MTYRLDWDTYQLLLTQHALFWTCPFIGWSFHRGEL